MVSLRNRFTNLLPLSPLCRSNMFSVKGLVESGSLTVLPSDYVCSTSPTDFVTQHKEEETIPIIDFSQLISSTPVERSKVVQDIGHACKEWSCFMVRKTTMHCK